MLQSFLHWRVPTEKPTDDDVMRSNREVLEQSATHHFYEDYRGKPGQQPAGKLMTSLGFTWDFLEVQTVWRFDLLGLTGAVQTLE